MPRQATGRAALLCLPLWLSATAAATPTGTRLRTLTPPGFTMGAAIDFNQLTNSTYTGVLQSEYNLGMAENATKMAAIEATQGTFDFSQGDAIVSFAQANGMIMQAGPLVWASAIPDWLANGTFDSAQLTSIMTTYITTVMQHYSTNFPGVVVAYEVVNEATTTGYGVWGGIPNYIQLAFQTARAADPNVLLFYNDYGYEQGGSGATAVYNVVAPLQQAGLVDAIGMQSHFDSPVDESAMASTMSMFTGLGLQVFVTELDYRIASSDGVTPTNMSDLTVEAQAYSDTLTACLSTPGCNQFMTWGFTDADSWIPSFFPGYGCALPFDDNYDAKPAYYAMQSLLAALPQADAGMPAGDAGTTSMDAGGPTSVPGPVSINSGGLAVGDFVADADFTGGMERSVTAAIDVSGVANAAPMAIYQDERYGPIVYAIPGLTPGAEYLVRLHFAETYFGDAGQRIFDVSINGTPFLTAFDIFAAAGAANRADVQETTATADGTGTITITYVTGSANVPESCGLEVLPLADAGTTATAGSTGASSSTASTTTTGSTGNASSGGHGSGASSSGAPAGSGTSAAHTSSTSSGTTTGSTSGGTLGGCGCGSAPEPTLFIAPFLLVWRRAMRGRKPSRSH